MDPERCQPEQRFSLDYLAVSISVNLASEIELKLKQSAISIKEITSAILKVCPRAVVEVIQRSFRKCHYVSNATPKDL